MEEYTPTEIKQLMKNKNFYLRIERVKVPMCPKCSSTNIREDIVTFLKNEPTLKTLDEIENNVNKSTTSKVDFLYKNECDICGYKNIREQKGLGVERYVNNPKEIELDNLLLDNDYFKYNDILLEREDIAVVENLLRALTIKNKQLKED